MSHRRMFMHEYRKYIIKGAYIKRLLKLLLTPESAMEEPRQRELAA